MIEQGRLNINTEDGFVTIHPETSTDQVLDLVSGKSMDEIINEVSNVKNLNWVPHIVNVVGVNQTRFEFTDPHFDKDSNSLLVFKNGEFMHPDSEYTVDALGSNPAVVLSTGINTGSVTIVVLRDALASGVNEGNVNGNVLKPNTLTVDKLNPVGFKEWLISSGIMDAPVVPEEPTLPPAWEDGYQPTGKRYGIKINKTDSNPATRIEYILDAVGMTPAKMNYTSGLFEYGSWADVWFVKKNYPCMVKFDGTEDYKVNPNDYSKKLDGTPSDSKNLSYLGNAMSKIPLVYVYQYEDTTHEYIILCDIKYDENYEAYAHTIPDGTIKEHIYLSSYKTTVAQYQNPSRLQRLSISGSTPSISGVTAVNELAQANAIGARWSTRSWAHRTLINNLLLVMGRNDDTQTVFGGGNHSSSIVMVAGTLDTFGQFKGYNTVNNQVKVFHMESWWGDVWERIQGIMTDTGKVKVKMTPPYNWNGVDYDLPGVTCPTVNGGQIKESLSSKYGRIPKDFSGSTTTYQCDGAHMYPVNLYIGMVGGSYGYALRAGASSLQISELVTSTATGVSVGLSSY